MHKILELCTSPDKGGLELYFADISNQLADHFNVTRVIGPKSALGDFLKPVSTEFIIEKKSHYLPLKAAKKLSKIIDEHHIELIHLHWNKDLALTIFAKLFSKTKPKVVLTRQMQFPSKKNSFYHQFIYKHLDYIIAITKTLEEDLRRFIPKRVQPQISTIYYGVKPLEKVSKEVTGSIRKQYAQEDDFLIGLFGRIDAFKGQHFLIEALKYAKQKSFPFKAVIVGHAMEESYLEELKRLVKEYKLEGRVTFTGFVNNPRELMQACDVVTLTTVEETFGLVLIEAMSVGIPVVGSNRGGVPEIITDRECGLLFESQNPESLFSALEILYHNEKMRQRFAQTGEEQVKKLFDYDNHLSNVTDLFHQLLKD